ncbi:MAG: CDP-alcohol phosphatidyltransferase family protein [Deltaproteobacteria bacterium]|nr:CDP-alcohol phosphatidyltransferase family protein [Deltaproteobacteria bacterium]
MSEPSTQPAWLPSRPISAFFSAWRDMHVRQLMQADVNPNTLTAIGFGINVVAAIALACGYPRSGAAVIFLAGMFDVLDGAYARKAHKVTSFGAFFDSTIDRFSDIVIFTGIAFHFAFGEGRDLEGQRHLYFILTSVALMGSVLTSYVRARAENIIPDCHVGYMERAERTVLLIIAGAANHIYMAMWLIAVLSHLTVLRRIIHFRTELHRIDAEKGAGTAGAPPTSTSFQNPVLNWVFFNFPRRTWQWDICCGIVILLSLFPPFPGPIAG